ncbi:YybH family protein [Flagellimonas allohymeniacidonis]|uniref:SgcJ/EcaC family oxidoreductase n=1 Tax=Flagellimonas allohymeniacidonis TaxID=2517819 RepID=A0A4Q8QE87_9FLAO|nr:nuclear transport factor 2 family protein [Allomuricauda hymeniacidonis]TAI47468.1 SgcJ/EcaC family oxidoreductase [Allomuricauda hymeniacidonis]
MKNMMATMCLSLLLTGCGTNTNKKEEQIENKTDMKTEESQKIKKLLLDYRDALNTSDVEKVMSLYTQNGVFMASAAPTAVGTDQVKGAYEFVFSQIQLSIEFFIDEIQVLNGYAIARSTSKGSTLIHATNETVPEENREIFVLKQEDGDWKIDRYMFNKMQ